MDRGQVTRPTVFGAQAETIADLRDRLRVLEPMVLNQRARVTVLRREVRRLNEKVAAMGAVITARQAWAQVERERERRLAAGTAMWALRQALGLTACEVSNEDVLRAAAKALAGRRILEGC